MTKFHNNKPSLFKVCQLAVLNIKTNYYFGFALEATKCTETFATHSPRCVRMLGMSICWSGNQGQIYWCLKQKPKNKCIYGQYLPMAANLKKWQLIRFNLYQYLVFERFITLCLFRTYMCILVSCTEYRICIVQLHFKMYTSTVQMLCAAAAERCVG